jgi:hypothetical protein
VATPVPYRFHLLEKESPVHRGPARLASLATTATLVIGLPGPAHAATGTFPYRVVGFGQEQIINPGKGCHQLPSHLGRAALNQTDSPVVLFALPVCTGYAPGQMVVLGPGEQSNWDFLFYSVWFDR